MKYQIIHARELFIVLDDDDKFISYHYSLIKAELYIKKLEYIRLMKIIMTDS